MTPAEFKAAYPEFANTADSVIQARLDEFGLIYNADYGDLADHLQGLYAAHQVSVFSGTSAAPTQPVTSRKVADISWSYADDAVRTAGPFGSTRYGLEFHRLMQLFGRGPIVAEPHLG